MAIRPTVGPHGEPRIGMGVAYETKYKRRPQY